ncbi:hypothetical protein PHPALM_28609 [Phytophthora palmivora]|uniref:Uncharacterized protein n=1 Tax=Phytophthora palmivora TaxID=4796 RepID=A0A2P4X9N9_9STRA|nr:hypothetical protein PHPALM_28609 [Phytophthora palmivora]
MYVEWQNLAYQTTVDEISEVDSGVVKSVKSVEIADEDGRYFLTKMEEDMGSPTMADEGCIKEGGTLFAKALEDQMAK